MSEPEDTKKKKPAKLETAAEETGALVGKGLRKTWSVAKSFGKGLVDTIDKKDEKKDANSSTCPLCHASLPLNSNFCPHCGKRT